MTDLVFTEEPARDQSRSWTVRESATGDVVGGVEWLYVFGAYGFASAPGGDAFSDAAVMREVGRFLDEVNR